MWDNDASGKSNISSHLTRRNSSHLGSSSIKAPLQALFAWVNGGRRSYCERDVAATSIAPVPFADIRITMSAICYTMLMKILLIVVVITILWSIYGYFSSSVEQAEYSVIKKADGYEIREYSPSIVAQTTVSGAYDTALSDGFRIIAGYIFGGNVKKEGIAMTAPVIAQSDISEKIAMTAPVTARTQGESSVVSFVMPKKYTLDTLPKPTDSRVKLVEVPAKMMAVLRFSWVRNADRVKAKERQLLDMLARDGIKTIGTVSYAGYSAPWTPLWMSRNEVMVEIAQ